MKFKHSKKVQLSKLDKSKKGSIDERIKDLLDAINKNPNYFTTSSCSGRIMLIKPGNKKNECEWLFVSHNTIDKLPDDIDLKQENLWFRMEPMILHVSCKDLESAEILLKLTRDIGLKKTGLISIRKLIVEIEGSEKLDTLTSVISDFKPLIKEANKKLENNWKKMEKLNSFFNTLLE